MGLTPGERGAQAVQMVIGVALGIAVADLLVSVIGGGSWQITLILASAMGLAILLGPRQQTFVQQAGISGLLVVTLERGEGLTDSLARGLDALVGGAVALVFSQLLFPIHPLRRAADRAADVWRELADAVDRLAGAVDERDPDMAADAGVDIHEISTAALRDALDVGRTIARRTPRRRGARAGLDELSERVGPLQEAIRHARLAADATGRALELHDAPGAGGDDYRAVAAAMRAVATATAGEQPEGDPAQLARQAADRLDAVDGLAAAQLRRLSHDVLAAMGALEPQAADGRAA